MEENAEAPPGPEGPDPLEPIPDGKIEPISTEPWLIETAVRFLQPIGLKARHMRSRLAVLPDGTTSPVLLLLAKAKFLTGAIDAEFVPVWEDGDPRNETFDNVVLLPRGEATGVIRGKRGSRRIKLPTRSKLGVPAGTKEYMAAWRAANADRVRQYAIAAKARRDARKENMFKEVKTIEALVVEHDPLLARLHSMVKSAAAAEAERLELEANPPPPPEIAEMDARAERAANLLEKVRALIPAAPPPPPPTEEELELLRQQEEERRREEQAELRETVMSFPQSFRLRRFGTRRFCISPDSYHDGDCVQLILLLLDPSGMTSPWGRTTADALSREVVVEP